MLDKFSPELKYIGKKLTLVCIEDHIVKIGYKENTTFLLNQVDFDELALDYRERFKHPMPMPFMCLGVLIKEAGNFRIPLNRIGVIKNDSESLSTITENTKERFEKYDGEIPYRCGWCGKVVDESGNVLYGIERQRIINYIESNIKPRVEHKHGSCCPNGNR